MECVLILFVIIDKILSSYMNQIRKIPQIKRSIIMILWEEWLWIEVVKKAMETMTLLQKLFIYKVLYYWASLTLLKRMFINK